MIICMPGINALFFTEASEGAECKILVRLDSHVVVPYQVKIVSITGDKLN